MSEKIDEYLRPGTAGVSCFPYVLTESQYTVRTHSVDSMVRLPHATCRLQVKPGGHQAYDTFADDALRCSFVLWVLGVWRPGPDAGAARPHQRHGLAGPSGGHTGPTRQPSRR